MADKEVSEKKEGKVAVLDAAMFEEDAGAGMTMDQDDLALPFLKVLSALDPLIQEGEIDAKAGDLYNTVTNTVYNGKEGVRVIPAHYERRFLHWAPRGSGAGAPISIYGPDDQRPETKRDENDNKEGAANALHALNSLAPPGADDQWYCVELLNHGADSSCGGGGSGGDVHMTD